MAQAFQRSLERLLDRERADFGRRLAVVHLVVGIGAALLALHSLLTVGLDYFGPSILTSTAFAIVGVSVYAAARVEKLRPQLSWVLPLVDLPLIAIGQSFQLSRLMQDGDGWMSLATVISIAAAFCVASVLSLSRRVVVTTVVLAATHVALRTVALGVLPQITALAMLSFATVGACSWAYVTRLRSIIFASRQDDLMGKYLLGPRIGVGGMAEVFEATYSPEGGFERKVAVKKILPAFANDPAIIEMFRREAEVCSQLAHPNVVQILDFGAAGSTYFLAMEFIDGVPLSQLLEHLRAERAPMSLHGAIFIALQLAEALDHVHRRQTSSGDALQLVHRDVNPPNVMITAAGDVKLTDFGIARGAAHPAVTAPGVLRGKLAYASPEQLNGAPVDARADLYSLGVTLHELVTGEPLFSGTNDIDVLRAALNLEIAPPSRLRGPEVPAELDTVVLGLLERDVERRTARAEDVRRQLLALPLHALQPTRGRRELAELVVRARSGVGSAKVHRLPQTLGRYAVLGELARGGMAQILLAYISGPSGFRRPVVIKRILPHVARDPSFVRMMLDEARIVAGIRHPNVVHVEELTVADGELFFAMEYLEGESLAALVRRLQARREPLPQQLAIHIVCEACAGLHAAHQAVDELGNALEVVHRDVSPHNLFVTYDGHIKVLDFGVARAAHRLSQTDLGRVKGRLEYMSPEQCRGDPLDRRSDVFALGIVLYEITTGRSLFARPSPAETVRAIAEPVIPPSRVAESYPRGLDAICLRALSLARDERFATMADMRRELSRLALELPSIGDNGPADALADLMRIVFADRIAEKQEMLALIRAGSTLARFPALEPDPPHVDRSGATIGTYEPSPRR